jgi:hypothetical protein
MLNKFFIGVIIAIAVAIGFLRDYFFVSINHIIETGHDPGGKFSIFKWALTLLFSLLYLVITCVVLFLLFRSKQYVRIGIFSYLFLLTLSLLASAFGSVFSSFENVYPFVRTIMGIAQSPVVMMILVPVCYFDQRTLKKQI